MGLSFRTAPVFFVVLSAVFFPFRDALGFIESCLSECDLSLGNGFVLPFCHDTQWPLRDIRLFASVLAAIPNGFFRFR